MTSASAILIALIFTGLGAAKIAAVKPMRDAAAHLGFSVTHYRVIGGLELAAVAGILAGTAIPLLGIVAAVGLLLLMAGAVIAHLAAHDHARVAAPLAIAALIATYIVSAQI
jgi:hypothetical protein